MVGVDLSPEMIERAREGRPSGDYLVHSYREPLPPSLGRFEVALAVGCLDFCDDLPRTLHHLSEASSRAGACSSPCSSAARDWRDTRRSAGASPRPVPR